MIYMIRCLSALCLFSLLGSASVLLTKEANLVLAFGYRFAMMMAPIFCLIFSRRASFVAGVIGLIGTLALVVDQSIVKILSSALVAVGLSVQGFLIKAEAAETPKGAAHNKVALNIGSLASGGLIASMISVPKEMIWVLSLIMGACCVLDYLRRVKTEPKASRSFSWEGLGEKAPWALVGIAIGIKFFGVLALLPQILLAESNVLPSWFGIMLSMNALVVILFQIKIIRWTVAKPNHLRTSIVVCAMIIGFILLGVSNHLGLSNLWVCAIWIFCLSIVECFCSYLDALAAERGALLVKEMFVGVGASLTVFVARSLNISVSPGIMGLLGASCLVIGFLWIAAAATKRPRVLLGHH
jgi:hypothetical protein